MAHRSTIAATILATAPPLPLTDSQWEAVAKAIKLSKQEAKVVELALRGLGNRQIAIVLGISGRTVNTYFQDRINKKTGTRGRMQLSMHVLAMALRFCPCRCRENDRQANDRRTND